MKRTIWVLLLAIITNGSAMPALAQSSRVQDTLSQTDPAIAELIRVRQQQVAEAETAVSELAAQLALARGNRQPGGFISLKKAFLIGAVVSASALIYGISTTTLKGEVIILPIPGRGTFIGLFGLVANGVGYMVTDATEIAISPADDAKLSADLQAAQAELAALKRSLDRLKAKSSGKAW